MRRILTLWSVLVVGLAGSGWLGCGGSAELPPPDLTAANRIAIAPFLAEEPDPNFGMLVARDLGNQLYLALKREKEGIEVVYDQSDELRPVSEALQKLNLQLAEVYADPKLAGRVAEELSADLLILGRIRKIRYETKEDDTPVFDMSQYEGLSKADTRYVITWQRATTRVWVKVVNPEGQVVWQTGSTPPEEPKPLTGFLRYARAYLSQSPERPPVPQEVMEAHMRDHIWRLVAWKLYPSFFPEVKIPVWKERPQQTFKTSGGVVRFE